jgi:hypothetical protein
VSGFAAAESAWLDPDSLLFNCPECGGRVVDTAEGRFECTYEDCDWTSDE